MEGLIGINRRSKEIVIRVCDEEYEVIKKKAENLNQKVAVYIRRMAVQGEIKRYDLSEVRDLTRAFRMIGTELNQIAKVANSTNAVTEKDVQKILRQYQALENILTKYLKPLKPNVLL